MKFSIEREALLKPLNLVAGVVERRQTLPILANVLISVADGKLSLTGTDLEVELLGSVSLEGEYVSGEITVPARKLADICKSLPDGSVFDLALDGDKAIVKSGRSRFTLATLPAVDFPLMETGAAAIQVNVNQPSLKKLIDSAGFAMAQQDVRYYLNGMLWEISANALKLVATDGHRLALGELQGVEASGEKQIILPRKAVLEVARLMSDSEQLVTIELGDTHFKATTGDFVFASKLVDGKFPDYDRVIPRNSDKLVIAQREDLRSALARTAILSNEKFRGVRLTLASGELTIQANNPEQEEAVETLAVDYQGDTLEVGFNVSYLLDVLQTVSTELVQLSLADANSSALLEAGVGDEAQSLTAMYVVMPMRL